MKVAVTMVVLLAATSAAHAESKSETVRVSLDGGIAPGFAIAGVEAAVVLHPNIEIAANAGVTLGLTGAVMPRLRFAHGPWRFLVGAGPTASAIVNLSFADDQRGGLIPAVGLASQASVAYVTKLGLTMQASAGAGAMVFGEKMTEPKSEVFYYPIANVGVGWSF